MLLFALPALASPPDLEMRLFESVVYADGTAQAEIFVTNNGTEAAPQFFVDLFLGEAYAPAIGDIGECWGAVGGLAGRRGVEVVLQCDGLVSFGPGWIDLIVDTDRYVTESNEANNIESFYVYWSDAGSFEWDL